MGAASFLPIHPGETMDTPKPARHEGHHLCWSCNRLLPATSFSARGLVAHQCAQCRPRGVDELDGRALIEDDERIVDIVAALGEASAPPFDGQGREPPNSERMLPGARPSEPSSVATF